MSDSSAAAKTRFAAAAAEAEVVVRAQHAPDIRIPNAQYCFAYRIVVRNSGETPFRLISRYWRIADGDGGMREIRGEGVVGEQPRIVPGGEFAYTSFVDMPTPAGTMSGEYTMRLDSGEEFQVQIPQFSLAVPGIVH